jgi:uncharacterized OsmC-like protein
MQAIVDYLGGVQFVASARGHQIISDQPSENRGDDAGMTPPELFLSSVGTCAAYYALEYLKAHAIPAAGLRVIVSADKAAAPPRLGRIRIAVEAPGAEETRHHDGLLRAVRRCLIHNTLEHPPEIEIRIEQLALSRTDFSLSR